MTEYSWIMGSPAQTDDTNFSWSLGSPFIRFEGVPAPPPAKGAMQTGKFWGEPI